MLMQVFITAAHHDCPSTVIRSCHMNHKKNISLELESLRCDNLYQKIIKFGFNFCCRVQRKFWTCKQVVLSNLLFRKIIDENFWMRRNENTVFSLISFMEKKRII